MMLLRRLPLRDGGLLLRLLTLSPTVAQAMAASHANATAYGAKSCYDDDANDGAMAMAIVMAKGDGHEGMRMLMIVSDSECI